MYTKTLNRMEINNGMYAWTHNEDEPDDKGKITLEWIRLLLCICT